MATSRTDFNETWLSESPKRIQGKKDYFSALLYSIKELISFGKKPKDINSNIRKIEMENVVYYWYELDNKIQLIIELDKKHQGFIVNLVGKDKELKGVPPYASDLYNVILNDTKRNLRIISDDQLSDERYAIWKRLYNQGHTVSIYNKDEPGQTFKTLHTIEEFDNYFGDENTYKKYQFVLVENSFLAETRCYFNTRKIRESFGYDLED